MREEIVKLAKSVLEIEAKAILKAIEDIDNSFVDAVDMIDRCSGKLLVIGIGKSGLIARKIASTFASIGIAAFFLHPSEGLHGDLGVIGQKDVVIILSNSGETSEISNILPLLKRVPTKIISITGNPKSTLAKRSDISITFKVKEEACPFGLIPTASTTVMLAIGDALAISILRKRGVTEQDFAFFHPGGALGKRLLLKVEDIMHTGDEIPLVDPDMFMRDAIFEITSKGLGVTGVLDKEGRLVGVITDGDLRRALEKYKNMLDVKVRDVMTKDPKWILKDSLAASALQKMEKHAITSLFVFSSEDKKELVGILHIHDILRAGVVL